MTSRARLGGRRPSLRTFSCFVLWLLSRPCCCLPYVVTLLDHMMFPMVSLQNASPTSVDSLMFHGQHIIGLMSSYVRAKRVSYTTAHHCVCTFHCVFYSLKAERVEKHSATECHNNVLMVKVSVFRPFRAHQVNCDWSTRQKKSFDYGIALFM
jgi:hypothetical protein